MFPRPAIKIPLWAALAIVGAAYLIRGFALRGGDLSPDMPGDLVVMGVVGLAVVLVWTMRVQAAREARAAARASRPGEESPAPETTTSERAG